MGPELVTRAERHADRIAIRAPDGSFTYRELLDDSARAAAGLCGTPADLAEGRVAFMVRPSYGYVVTSWAAWRAGGMAVPIGTALPDPEIEYVLDDATPAVAVADDAYAARLEPLARARGIRFVHVDDVRASAPRSLPRVDESRASMMLYTSGTTGRPKGVVHTHASVAAQVRSLVDAWAWTPDDHILCVLPLHHVHGIVNVLACALWSGAICDVHAAFDADAVWRHICDGELTLFMAVPTIYQRLITAYEHRTPDDQSAIRRACDGIRLMVSGSAALPVPTLERWREITGHTLLERYGMTEIGMALSNTLDDRRPGHVGRPLPGVDVTLRDDLGRPPPAGQAGEIHVRGPNLFREYWNRADATREAFVDGWFRTGDVACVDDDSYRILGRASVDIIKTGGEKVSALEIEDVLRTHASIVDCAVVGVADDEWGERVCAAIIIGPGMVVPGAGADETSGLRDWAKQRLAPYKVPRQFLVVDDLPRNALGKVTKSELKELFGHRAAG